MSEIVKSEYNALGEDNNYKTHFFKTSADQVVGLGRMKNTEYQVGDVVYSDTNNKVTLKCVTAGTTSNTELDISTKAVGESVEDGSVVWEVVSRDTVATIDQERPIKTFTDVEQFGGNHNMTEEELLSAMPNNSYLCLITNNYEGNEFPNFSLKQNGMLTIKKAINSNYADLTFIDQGFRVWRTTYKSWETPKFKPWYRMAVNGALSMPSNKSITISLTWDGNNAYYTAPADGWLAWQVTHTGKTGNPRAGIVNNAQNMGMVTPITEDRVYYLFYIPVAKGNECRFISEQSTAITGGTAKFVYAQSEV
jgi:hypothetical protein